MTQIARLPGTHDDAPHALRSPSTPIELRRVDASANVKRWPTRPHIARCRLSDGVEAELLVREDLSSKHVRAEGLPLSTVFGPAMAYDYGALLLACTGVDSSQSTNPSTRLALARYGFAALDPSLQAALGEPTVSETTAAVLSQEPTLAVNVLLRLPSIRLKMSWVMTVAGLQALQGTGRWQPVAAPASSPAWLMSLHAAIELVVGRSVLPLAECNSLRCGDIIRLAASSFDVSGRGSLRIASHRLLLRWLDPHHCFEVENMTYDAHPSPGTSGTPDSPQAATVAPIDTTAIPVCLSFSLGTLRLTIGELAALRPGSLIELKQGRPPRVSIEANGLPLGAGELVELDGQLAVEITQWPPSVPASSA